MAHDTLVLMGSGGREGEDEGGREGSKTRVLAELSP